MNKIRLAYEWMQSNWVEGGMVAIVIGIAAIFALETFA